MAIALERDQRYLAAVAQAEQIIGTSAWGQKYPKRVAILVQFASESTILPEIYYSGLHLINLAKLTREFVLKIAPWNEQRSIENLPPCSLTTLINATDHGFQVFVLRRATVMHRKGILMTDDYTKLISGGRIGWKQALPLLSTFFDNEEGVGSSPNPVPRTPDPVPA